MKTIRIAHLYYDLMNLYGENGNIRALVKQLEMQNIKVVVDFLSLEDKIDFEKFDFFYIGTGTLENAKLVLEDLEKYKKDILRSVDDGKFFLVTGDTISIFGKKFIFDNKELTGLELFDFVGKGIDFRIVGEQFYLSKLIDKDIIGFQNRDSVIDEWNDHLFEVTTGTGFKPNCMVEGVKKKNFIGTYLLGPILVRNPYLTEYLVKELLKKKDIKYKKIVKDISYKAYDEYLKNFKLKED